jgi:hypothetical protein
MPPALINLAGFAAVPAGCAVTAGVASASAKIAPKASRLPNLRHFDASRGFR